MHTVSVLLFSRLEMRQGVGLAPARLIRDEAVLAFQLENATDGCPFGCSHAPTDYFSQKDPKPRVTGLKNGGWLRHNRKLGMGKCQGKRY